MNTDLRVGISYLWDELRVWISYLRDERWPQGVEFLRPGWTLTSGISYLRYELLCKIILWLGLLFLTFSPDVQVHVNLIHRHFPDLYLLWKSRIQLDSSIFEIILSVDYDQIIVL